MKQNNKLAQKTWRIFSEYIRLRDSDENGYVKCITCGRIHFYKDHKINAGHYFHRGHGSYTDLDFNELNIWPQCVYCNKYHNGARGEYAEFLINKKILEKLKCLKNYKLALMDFELELIYKKYKEKLKIEKEKRAL